MITIKSMRHTFAGGDSVGAVLRAQTPGAGGGVRGGVVLKQEKNTQVLRDAKDMHCRGGLLEDSMKMLILTCKWSRGI